jgi:hypothetical protein
MLPLSKRPGCAGLPITIAERDENKRKKAAAKILRILPNLYTLKICCAINSQIRYANQYTQELFAMSLSDTMGKLENILGGLVRDLAKVARGNKSAAQRVRVGTLRLEKVGKQFRKESVAAIKRPKKKAKKRKR